jgi:hypothetical protein
MEKVASRREIENARHTKAQLAQWGVPWPPPKGWRKRLLQVADKRDETSVSRQIIRPKQQPYKPGELHRVWPEWRWDGEKFRRA